MNKWDDLALLTFITCDIIVENSNNIKFLYRYYYETLKVETKDICKRLFR